MDERFWTASSLMTLFHDDTCQENFARLHPEAIALLEDYLAGEIGTMEFMTSIEDVRRKGVSKPSV
jgi:hypothetical protein